MIWSRCGGELLYYDGETHAGMFALPKYLREAVAAERRVIAVGAPLFVE